MSTKEQAEIERIQAERDFFRGNARVAEILAEQELIGLQVRRRNEEEELARNEYHNVYLFDEDVNDESVGNCIHTLAGWTRGKAGLDIEIQLDTQGGSIFAGFKLVDFIRHLRSQGHHVTIVVFGVAASMGASILQAADTRVMGKNAFLLLHEGSMSAGGNWGSIQDDVKLFEKLQDRILDLLADRAKITRTKIKNGWKRTDWWLNADEALEAGFVDDVR